MYIDPLFTRNRSKSHIHSPFNSIKEQSEGLSIRGLEKGLEEDLEEYIEKGFRRRLRRKSDVETTPIGEEDNYKLIINR